MSNTAFILVTWETEQSALRAVLGDVSRATRIMWVVGAEHVVLFVNLYILYATRTEPAWVRREGAAGELTRRRAMLAAQVEQRLLRVSKLKRFNKRHTSPVHPAGT